MKVNGDEFLRNIERQQTNNTKTSSPELSGMENYYNNINENTNNSGDQELDDIRLASSKNNKQKYILFGLSLVLLFLITIVTLRLLSEDSTKNNFSDNNLIEEKNYSFTQTKNKEMSKDLDIDKIVQAEENIKTIQNKQETVEKEVSSDVFGLEKEKKAQKDTQATMSEEKIIPKEIKKEPIKPIKKIEKVTPLKEKVLVKETPKKAVISKNISGIYIQVGAFTKFPDAKLLKKLKKDNLDFIIHKVNIKGKNYNKLLIGKYKSRTDALKTLSKIKNSYNKNAYILRIK